MCHITVQVRHLCLAHGRIGIGEYIALIDYDVHAAGNLYLYRILLPD